MGPGQVVAFPPFPYHPSGLLQVVEPVLIQAFIPQLAVETLNVGIRITILSHMPLTKDERRQTKESCINPILAGPGSSPWNGIYVPYSDSTLVVCWLTRLP